MTSDLVKAYPFLSDAEANRFDTGRESIGKCPRCGSPVYVGKGNYYCSNRECSFCMWEDNKFFTSKKKKLTKKIAAELLDKGWCRVTGLYTPKRKFDRPDHSAFSRGYGARASELLRQGI